MSVPSHISRYRKHQSGELPMSLDYSAQPLQRCDLAIASRRTILPASQPLGQRYAGRLSPSASECGPRATPDAIRPSNLVLRS
jgi:hypothetical protein